MNQVTYYRRLTTASNIALGLDLPDSLTTNTPFFDTSIPYLYTLYVLYLLVTYYFAARRRSQH